MTKGIIYFTDGSLHHFHVNLNQAETVTMLSVVNMDAFARIADSFDKSVILFNPKNVTRIVLETIDK